MATLSSLITPSNIITAETPATLTNKTIDGDNNTITNVDLAGGVKGTLPVANGGTGATSLTGVLKGNGTSAVSAGDVNLASEVTGTLPVANGGTGITSFGTGVATALGQNVTGTGGAVLASAPVIAGPEFTGAIFGNGSQRSNIVAVSALDIDCAAGNYFTKTISANSTFTFSNVPASRAFAFTLELTHTSGTVTWPSAVKWPDDEAPELTTGKTHLFMFVTDDGGTRWRGAALVDYVN